MIRSALVLLLLASLAPCARAQDPSGQVAQDDAAFLATALRVEPAATTFARSHRGDLLVPKAVAFLDDAHALVGAHDGALHLVAVGDGQPALVSRTKAHDEAVTSIVVAGSGTVVTTSHDGTARRWRFDGRDLQPAGALPHPGRERGLVYRVTGAALAPDGRWGLTATFHAIRAWRLDGDAPAELAELPGPQGDGAVAAGPDGWALATVGQDSLERVRLLRVDPAAGVERIALLPGAAPPLALSPDGRMALTGRDLDRDRGSARGRVLLWSLEEPARPRIVARWGGSATVESVAFSADGRFALAGQDDHALRIARLDELLAGRSGVIVEVVEDKDAGDAIGALSPDGTWLLTPTRDDDRVLCLRRVELAVAGRAGRRATLEAPVVCAPAHAVEVRQGDAIAVAPGDRGSRLVTTLRPRARREPDAIEDGVAVWELGAAAPVHALDVAVGRPSAVALSRDLLLVGGSDGSLHAWRLEREGDLLRAVEAGTTLAHGDEVDGVALSADALRAVTCAGVQGRVWTLDPAGGPARKLASLQHGSYQGAAGVAADGRTALCASFMGGGATLWRIGEDGVPAQLAYLREDEGEAITCGALSSDGRTLITGAGVLQRGVARTWRLDDPGRPQPGPALHTDGASAVALSPDGLHAAVADERVVRLWRLDPERPTLVAVLVGWPAPGRGLAFTPDGDALVASGRERSHPIWRPFAPRLVTIGTDRIEWTVPRSRAEGQPRLEARVRVIEGVGLELAVRNAGTAAAYLARADLGRDGRSAPVALGTIEPGRTVTRRVPWADARAGPHEVTLLHDGAEGTEQQRPQAE